MEWSGHSLQREGAARAHHPLMRWPALLLSLALAAALAGCSDNGPEATAEAPPLPEWIISVEPRPGSDSSPLRRVEVKHDVMTDGESVRLSIDGTDVTSYADFGREETVGGPGRLVYDFEQARDFLPLDPGTHTAKVERVRLPQPGQQHEVLDTYSWSFTIQ